MSFPSPASEKREEAALRHSFSTDLETDGNVSEKDDAAPNYKLESDKLDSNAANHVDDDS